MSEYQEIKNRKGENLRRLRETNKMHQWQIAEILNCKTSNVSEMEHGKRTISDRVIGILCEHFKIDAEEFFRNPKSKTISDVEEMQILKNARQYPTIKHQLTVISDALAKEYREVLAGACVDKEAKTNRQIIGGQSEDTVIPQIPEKLQKESRAQVSKQGFVEKLQEERRAQEVSRQKRKRKSA